MPRQKGSQQELDLPMLPLLLYDYARSLKSGKRLYLYILCIVVSVTDDAMKDKLEEMESIDYFHETLQRIPRVKALCSRLKTKPVEDPLLLDREGNPLQEKNLLR